MAILSFQKPDKILMQKSTDFKINGVDHEFASIPGVLEDVTEIVLNLKQVRFKKLIDSEDSSNDSIFTPIKNVRYHVENTRVEQKTDYEKLSIQKKQLRKLQRL